MRDSSRNPSNWFRSRTRSRVNCCRSASGFATTVAAHRARSSKSVLPPRIIAPDAGRLQNPSCDLWGHDRSALGPDAKSTRPPTAARLVPNTGSRLHEWLAHTMFHQPVRQLAQPPASCAERALLEPVLARLAHHYRQHLFMNINAGYLVMSAICVACCPWTPISGERRLQSPRSKRIERRNRATIRRDAPHRRGRGS
jgi:hypothetical protein